MWPDFISGPQGLSVAEFPGIIVAIEVETGKNEKGKLSQIQLAFGKGRILGKYSPPVHQYSKCSGIAQE